MLSSIIALRAFMGKAMARPRPAQPARVTLITYNVTVDRDADLFRHRLSGGSGRQRDRLVADQHRVDGVSKTGTSGVVYSGGGAVGTVVSVTTGTHTHHPKWNAGSNVVLHRQAKAY